jgi:primosomal protein N' (replication factor Y)
VGARNDLFAEIALNIPVFREFTYAIPKELRGRLDLGSQVSVMFHGRRTKGFIVSFLAETDVPPSRILSILGFDPHLPPLPKKLLLFAKKLAETYACSWGAALEAALPGSLKRKNVRTVQGVDIAKRPDEILELAEELELKREKQSRILRHIVELCPPVPLKTLLQRCGVTKSPVDTLVKKGVLRVVRIPVEDEFLEQSKREFAPRHFLNLEQEAAVERILAPGAKGEHRTFLLHGVTGSGKTEVYLRVLEEVRKRGRGAIILVPEISLTPQTCGRFLSRFPDVAVLHSSLTDATRARQWLRLARGDARIVVGARSALFAPVKDLGLIVVDEEHESSFKQQQVPRYHAREMAVLRGMLEDAVVVLGSATPSLESWEAAKSGRYELLELPNRVGGGRMPKILVEDMRYEKPYKGRPAVVSKRLEILMSERLRVREQVLLFLNRRGFSPVLFCNLCGATLQCPNCEVAMTWHSARGRLVCHYCMREERHPDVCPTCKASRPVTLGAGTERVEDWVRRRFPDAIVARMDSDTMARREMYEKVLGAFRDRQIDILIGTQMIAKGLDFPDVTLVGVIAADVGLFQPDFRAEERTFQLLAQVAGRAGRGEKEGLVLFQTMNPSAPAIEMASRIDYTGFVRDELEHRRILSYPPFSRLVRIVVESHDPKEGRERIEALTKELKSLHPSDGFMVLGPAVAPLARIRKRFRFHSLVKCLTEDAFSKVRGLLAPFEAKKTRQLRFLIDVDPVSML